MKPVIPPGWQPCCAKRPRSGAAKKEVTVRMARFLFSKSGRCRDGSERERKGCIGKRRE